jgi:hypothetical protein
MVCECRRQRLAEKDLDQPTIGLQQTCPLVLDRRLLEVLLLSASAAAWPVQFDMRLLGLHIYASQVCTETALRCRDEGYGARNRPGQLEARPGLLVVRQQGDHVRQQVADGLTVYLPGTLHGADEPHGAVFPEDVVVVSAPIAGHRQPAELRPFRIRVPPRCKIYAGSSGRGPKTPPGPIRAPR